MYNACQIYLIPILSEESCLVIRDVTEFNLHEDNVVLNRRCP